MEKRYGVTGIILSGGKSARMGRDKAFIEIDGIPIIQRIYNIFEKIFNEIIIVTNQKESYESFKAKIVSDLIVNHGALGGLYTGLFFASNPYSFCVACDMPFLKESMIQYLIKQADGFDAIVPRTDDGLQPLHAIYSKSCIPPIKKLIDMGKYKIIDFYPLVRIKIIEEPEFINLDRTKESFININTTEDLSLLNKRKKAV
ncbi:MAG: molybdenum cofactor guanylyltransferase [Deltaproteobacteria bacterium]|nr:molybdenum cofactor guanylyltransferase [Deltaproteobacteria bacterium]